MAAGVIRSLEVCEQGYVFDWRWCDEAMGMWWAEAVADSDSDLHVLWVLLLEIIHKKLQVHKIQDNTHIWIQIHISIQTCLERISYIIQV